MAPPAKKKKKHSSADHRLISSSAAIGGKEQQTLGSVMTSLGKRRSLRVAKKMNQILRKIWICTDVLMDILPFFDHAQLGLKLALLSPRFNALVDKHFDGKSELIIWRQITIRKDIDAEAKFSVRMDRKSVQFPLPDYQMPNKIRFEDLHIEYIDHSVITFLRANQQIFDKKDTNSELFMPNPYKIKNVQPIWDVFAREIWPIFATNLRYLNFNHGGDLEHLRRHTSPTIFSDLGIISIHSADLFPEVIVDDGPNSTAGQALSKWLQIPTKDGKPKQLSCRAATSKTTKFVNDFKEAFLRATSSSASYVIRLEPDFFESLSFVPFELMNKRTNEMLTLEKEGDYDENTEKDKYTYGDWLLKRCQIGGTIQWEDENPGILSNVDFNFYNGMDCIGPLSAPEAGKMSTKSQPKMNPGPSGQRKKK